MTEALIGPPHLRSRRALAFSAAAAEGRFALQACSNCNHVTYPPREVCPECWSLDLHWKDMSDGGELITETTLRTSFNDYFQERLPWRIGTVKLDVGPTVLAHVHGDVAEYGRVRMIARTDKSGQGVLMALPDKETADMADDRQLRELTCDPKSRRVLVTDGRTEPGKLMAKALLEAGASTVFVGNVEGGDELAKVPGVEAMPLDITDTSSVSRLAGEIGEKTDILINTAEYIRPGSTLERSGMQTARDEMETNYFGLMRLIQAFGPGMRARGVDGDACAWVNLLSVYALCNWPTYGTTSASQAAAYSLSQCLRGEFASFGVKVVNVLYGPLEESRPQAAPQRLADAVVHALQQGIEHVSLGAVAEDVVRRFKEDPFVLERELTQVGSGQDS
ncbi:MAG: SDR family NAD(P)-dependent oxidoreductase [Woeseiaceae bacterium]